MALQKHRPYTKYEKYNSQKMMFRAPQLLMLYSTPPAAHSCINDGSFWISLVFRSSIGKSSVSTAPSVDYRKLGKYPK